MDNDPIWVGREGTGQLTVSGGLVQGSVLKVAAVSTNTAAGTVSLLGGSLILSSNLVLGSDSVAAAQMSVAGGELVVTNSSGSAVLDLIRGTLTLNGGTMTLDHLGGTTPAGRLVFESGTLRTKGTAAANGVPFVVGDGIRAAVLELLDELLERSLVYVQPVAGAPRYGLLETVRQYGVQQMERVGEIAAVRDRHLAWCLALAEQTAPALQGPEQGAWLERLAREHDNLRAAYDRLESAGIRLQHIDVGGGIGIRYRDESPQPPARFVTDTLKIVGKRPHTVIFDPGRSIVGNAGVLLTRVEYVKPRFLVVDAAMTPLLSPGPSLDAGHGTIQDRPHIR